MDFVLPFILLFLASLSAGLLGSRFRLADEMRMQLLLAFSGSFLLSITLLHLVPESVEEKGHSAGLLILFGFFLQLLIQRFTHGAEHGHSHIHGENTRSAVFSVLAGLSVHAFMEGIPLGFNYRNPSTDASLFFAVGMHKLPEIIVIATLLKHASAKVRNNNLILVLFAALTPAAGLAAAFLGRRYFAVFDIVSQIIPIMAGAFIHIATTIFFESGTKMHALSRKKVVAMLLGVALATATIFFH